MVFLGEFSPFEFDEDWGSLRRPSGPELMSAPQYNNSMSWNPFFDNLWFGQEPRGQQCASYCQSHDHKSPDLRSLDRRSHDHHSRHQSCRQHNADGTCGGWKQSSEDGVVPLRRQCEDVRRPQQMNRRTSQRQPTRGWFSVLSGYEPRVNRPDQRPADRRFKDQRSEIKQNQPIELEVRMEEEEPSSQQSVDQFGGRGDGRSHGSDRQSDENENLLDLKSKDLSSDDSTHEETQSSPSADVLKELDRIKQELSELETRVERYSGDRTDREYLTIDELLTRALLSLDTIASHGNQHVRHTRKQLVQQAYRLVECLEGRYHPADADQCGTEQCGTECGNGDNNEQFLDCISDIKELFSDSKQ